MRLLLVDAGRRLPCPQGRHGPRTLDVSFDALQPIQGIGFGDGDALAGAAIAQHRRAATQRNRDGQSAFGLRQLQDRLDLLRQLVAQQQRPAAAERDRRIRIALDALRTPPRIQHIEESPFDARAILVAHHAIAMQGEGVAFMRQQHVPAPVCTSCTGLQQHRVARRVEAMQVEQV